MDTFLSNIKTAKIPDAAVLLGSHVIGAVVPAILINTVFKKRLLAVTNKSMRMVYLHHALYVMLSVTLQCVVVVALGYLLKQNNKQLLMYVLLISGISSTVFLSTLYNNMHKDKFDNQSILLYMLNAAFIVHGFTLCLFVFTLLPALKQKTNVDEKE